MLPVYLILVVIWFFFLRKLLSIEIGPDEVSIGNDDYSRRQPISFHVRPHNRAMRGEKHDRYFRGALEVVMNYGGVPVTIAEMRERDADNARALATRLTNALSRTPPGSPETKTAPQPASRPAPIPGARAPFSERGEA